MFIDLCEGKRRKRRKRRLARLPGSTIPDLSDHEGTQKVKELLAVATERVQEAKWYLAEVTECIDRAYNLLEDWEGDIST